ncbi:hypothetical protein D3C81_1702190 [compost metagenome]
MFDHLPTNAQQGFGVGQVFVFLLQLLQLVITEAEVFQLFKLIAEQLMACALFVARIGEALQLLASLAPALGGELNLAGQVGSAGVLVQQAAVSIGFQQGLVFMLAVDIDQQLAQ